MSDQLTDAELDAIEEYFRRAVADDEWEYMEFKARTDLPRVVADLQAMRAVIRDADLETWMQNAIAAGRVD